MFVLGGSPGAGKSGLTKFLQDNEFSNNVLVINGDDYRELHPKFDQLNDEFKEKTSEQTQLWAGKMVEALIRKSREEKFNVIVEGTFRTSEAPIKTLETYKEHSFDVNVAIMLTDAITAWDSTERRYQNAILAGEVARAVPKEHFETVIENLPQTIPEVFNQGIANDFLVFNRESIREEKTIFNGKESNVSELTQIVRNELASHKYCSKEIMAEVQKIMPLNEQEQHDLENTIDKQLAIAARGGKVLNVKTAKENIRAGISMVCKELEHNAKQEQAVTSSKQQVAKNKKSEHER